MHEYVEMRALAIGAGLDHWYWAARGNRAVVENCACGAAQPSASHLLWNCPAMPPLDFSGPRDRAEDRLWCPTVADPPPIHDWTSDLSRGRKRLRRLLLEADSPVVAVNGGAADGWAVWAVALRLRNRFLSVAAPVEGLDTYPLCAELQALREFLLAAYETCPRTAWEAWSDNRVALGIINRAQTTADYWQWPAGPHRAWQDQHVRFQWVPAHDRHKDWHPVPQVSAADLRNLNAAAHRACCQLLHRMRIRDRQRADWLQEKRRAELWAQCALRRAVACQHGMRRRYEQPD